MPEVRLIGDDGAQIGIKPIREALDIAERQDLDLVEIAPEAKPPVCRIMDYSKFKYQQEMKEKKARKHQATVQVKEIKFRPKIETHDFNIKKKHVERFLDKGAKVKVTIMFRGREVTHPDLGRKILDRLTEELIDIATVEFRPKLEGRNMTMVLAPKK